MDLQNTTTLYLVRHGETEENVANILQGHMPGHLTQKGIAQAEALRDTLSAVKFDALVCSDLKRCQDTAMILNLYRNLEIETTTLLRERDWGRLTGMNILKTRKNIDSSAEKVSDMYARAAKFLQWVEQNHRGQTVLAVGHGLIDRVIQGVIEGKEIRQVPKMNNAEVRIINVTTNFDATPHGDVIEASAN